MKTLRHQDPYILSSGGGSAEGSGIAPARMQEILGLENWDGVALGIKTSVRVYRICRRDRH